MNKTPKGALRDAVVITSVQKVEHYEMASYGTARTSAQVLGERGVARLLAQTLKEGKAADGKLTAIAERSVNQDAADEWRARDDEDAIVERSTPWVSETIDAASRTLAGGARRAALSVGLGHARSKGRTSRTDGTGKRTRSSRRPRRV